MLLLWACVLSSLRVEYSASRAKQNLKDVWIFLCERKTTEDILCPRAEQACLYIDPSTLIRV